MTSPHNAAILKTKLSVPLTRPNLVHRPRLLESLNGSLVSCRFTLVSAPAGCGKTTLVADWVAHSGRRVAWLSLDEEDNDPGRFLTYLTAALQQLDERIGRTVQQLLASPQPPPVLALLTLVLNDIAAVPELILAMDDYHLVTSDRIHQMVQFLVENWPPTAHLVLITRQDPPLPLPRLRVRGQIVELRERDLRFTAEEATAFLNQTMGLQLHPEWVAALENRTEGWIAGLQLAALALQQLSQDKEKFIVTFTGDDRYIMEYLMAEVLERQPPEVRQFLRQTSMLDGLTAPLCDVVTGRPGSQALLEQLESANLFLIALDHRREWYRYHNVFAEFLRATLTAAEREVLSYRAAIWHEAHGFVVQAVRHAADYGLISGNWREVERLIRRGADELLLSGNVQTVLKWLAALPEADVWQDGELATYKGWALTMTGETDQAEEYTRAAESRLRQALEAGAALGKTLALRAFLAAFAHYDYDRAIALASEALSFLTEGQPRWRIAALLALAESQERTRPIGEAIATFREARQVSLALGSQLFAAMVEMSLALALNNSGRRREALSLCEAAIERHTDRTGRPSPWVALLYSRLGLLHYESNELDLSRECHDRALTFTDQPFGESYVVVIRALGATTLYAQGEINAALEALQRASYIARQIALFDPDWFLAHEANIHLAQGDLTAALNWARSSGFSPEDHPDYMRLDAHLIYARLLLAQGHLSDARRWLARLERFTQERGLVRALLTVYVLQGLLADRTGDRVVVEDRLTRALRIAAPHDYFRAFLDEDPRVLVLLRDVSHIAPEFVAQLLAYGGAAFAGAGPMTPSPLVEPLSEREREVLRLIAAGLSNQEIAGQLVIAVGTVKRHLHHIYGKLGVKNRTHAIARARELEML